MVNEQDDDDVTFDVDTGEDTHTDEPELVDIEESGDTKLKKLRKKLEESEEERKKLQDELQRTKADFLNARRRLEEDRANDKIRHKKAHIEEMLPLADSFYMATSNTDLWEKADQAWRSGIAGIYAQLLKILKDAGVTMINPLHETFDPNKHEAVGTESVTDRTLVHKVTSVLQSGYEITISDRTELIRPARVIIGEINE